MLWDEDAISWLSYLYYNATLLINRKADVFYKKMVTWERSVPKKTVVKKFWTNSEDAMLLSGDKTIDELVAETGRSANAIKTRLWRFGKSETKERFSRCSSSPKTNCEY